MNNTALAPYSGALDSNECLSPQEESGINGLALALFDRKVSACQLAMRFYEIAGLLQCSPVQLMVYYIRDLLGVFTTENEGIDIDLAAAARVLHQCNEEAPTPRIRFEVAS